MKPGETLQAVTPDNSHRPGLTGRESQPSHSLPTERTKKKVLPSSSLRYAGDKTGRDVRFGGEALGTQQQMVSIGYFIFKAATQKSAFFSDILAHGFDRATDIPTCCHQLQSISTCVLASPATCRHLANPRRVAECDFAQVHPKPPNG